MARQVSRRQQRKLSTAAWFAIGCGSTLAVGLIALAIVFTMLSARPALPPEARASDSGSPVSAPSLEQQLSQAQQTARSGQAAEVALVIRQDELNALIQRDPPDELRNLRVYFGAGTIAATGDGTWHGRTIPITARGTPMVSDGRLRIAVSEVRLGTLPAPEQIRARLESELQRGVEQLAGSGRMRVTAVSVAPGVLTVQGWVGQQ